jgi:hypothetical protein
MRSNESLIVRGKRERAITGLPLGHHYPGELGVGVSVTAAYGREGWKVMRAVPVTEGYLDFASPPSDPNVIGYAAVACWGLALDGGSPSGWCAIGAPVEMLGRGAVDMDLMGGLPDSAGLTRAVTEAVIRVYHRRRDWAPSWVRPEDWKKLEQVFNLKDEDIEDGENVDSGNPVA